MLTKNLLKEGDIIVTKGGEQYIYMLTPSGLRFLNNNGWLDLKSFKENLIPKGYFSDEVIEKYTIIHLYRPKVKLFIRSNYEYKIVPRINFPFLLTFCIEIINDNFINLEYYV